MIMDDSLSLFLISLKIMRQLKSKDLKYNVERSNDEVKLRQNTFKSLYGNYPKVSVNLRKD